MARGDLNITLGLVLENFRKGLAEAERTLKKTGEKLESIGASLTTRLSLPLGGIGAAAVGAFAEFEKFEKGLAAVSSSAEEAENTLSRLRTLALQPGIDLQNAVSGSIRLQAVGFAAQEAETLMSNFAKAVTLAGGSGDDLSEVVKQITQIISKGKILREDFAVIQERVPAIGIAMNTAFGTTNVEKIRESGISAGEFVAKLTEGIAQSRQFQNVSGGLSNSIDNFKQALKGSLVVLGREISQSINLEKVLSTVAGAVNRLVTAFTNLSPTAKKIIVVTGGILALIGPLLAGFGAFLKVLSLVRVAMVAATGPIGIAITAIALISAALIKAYNSSKTFRAGINGVAAVVREVFTVVKEIVGGFLEGFRQLGEGNFKQAAAAFGKSFVKANPITLAITEGSRFSDAYKKAVADTLAEPDQQVKAAGEEVISSAFAIDPTKFAAEASEKLGTAIKLIKPVKSIGSLDLLGGLTDQLAGDQVTRFAKSLEESFKNTAKAVAPTTNALTQLAKTYELLETKSDVLGVSFDLTKEKLNATQTALTQAIEAGYTPLSGTVEYLQTQLATLNAEVERQNTVLEATQQVASTYGAAFQSAASSTVKSFKDIGRAALASAKDVIAAKLREATAAFIADAFGKLGIFGTILAAGAGALVGGLFGLAINRLKIPALATGGIVDRPTIALIGEKGREAVVPLPADGGLFSGGAPNDATVRVRGEDLYFVFKRVERKQNRIN